VSRILFLAANEWEPWGGSEELWSRAAKVLRQRGERVSISAKWFGSEVPGVAQLAAEGCSIRYRRYLRGSPYLYLAAQRVLRPFRLDDLSGHDLVVISQGMNADGLRWMRACQRRKLRYVVIAQSAAESWWPYDQQAEQLGEAYDGAEASFFVSRANLELTRRQVARDLPRAEVVRNPFNVPYDALLPWPEPDAAGELRFACVGRLDPRGKGQDLILEVLSLPRWRERPVRVSFVGAGASERGMRRLAEMYGLRSVRFSGYVRDTAAVWRDHHALLLPSRYEGLPLAVVEAMLLGRPVVVTAVAGNPEVVRDGETGFLAASPTARHVDEAMQRAWDGRTRLRDMGVEAARWIRTLIPPDPARDLADRIQEIANG
jgi:glycosyltransferase involved in cell wall biosynthesis